MLLIEHLGERRINKRVDVRRLLLLVSLVVLRWRCARANGHPAAQRRGAWLPGLRQAADL